MQELAMPTLTAFSFGYYGWGTSTEHLVRAVDSVERSRGYKPPIFVDTRIQRSGRAPGFVGRAFEELLGPKRHRWIKRLGNKRVHSGVGPAIQIADPTAAEELLAIVQAADEDRRRVIFFCSCQLAKVNGVASCHRTRVGTLLLGAARRQNVVLEVIEWPGGKPRQVRVPLSHEMFQSVANGRMSIPLGIPRKLADFASLPSGSIATLSADGEKLHRLVGPAMWQGDEWRLPVEYSYCDPATTILEYRHRAELLRRQWGIVGRRVHQ